MDWKRAITPNESLPSRSRWWIVGSWTALWLAYWSIFRPAIFPSPSDVLNALPSLWTRDGLGQELLSSLTVNVEALAVSIFVSLPLAYLSRTPAVRPLALGISKLRFLSPAVFFLLFLFLVHDGHDVKVLMLAAGESFFLVTTMVGVVAAIPDDRYDDARTLRMTEWEATWYVTVRGTVPQALDAIRDNAAMGFSMLMMVEGFVRSEGGLGVMLLNSSKYLNFADTYALALVILAVGLAQDWLIGQAREVVCPYAL